MERCLIASPGVTEAEVTDRTWDADSVEVVETSHGQVVVTVLPSRPSGAASSSGSRRSTRTSHSTPAASGRSTRCCIHVRRRRPDDARPAAGERASISAGVGLSQPLAERVGPSGRSSRSRAMAGPPGMQNLAGHRQALVLDGRVVTCSACPATSAPVGAADPPDAAGEGRRCCRIPPPSSSRPTPHRGRCRRRACNRGSGCAGGRLCRVRPGGAGARCRDIPGEWVCAGRVALLRRLPDDPPRGVCGAVDEGRLRRGVTGAAWRAGDPWGAWCCRRGSLPRARARADDPSGPQCCRQGSLSCARTRADDPRRPQRCSQGSLQCARARAADPRRAWPRLRDAYRGEARCRGMSGVREG